MPVMCCEVNRLHAARPPITCSFLSRISFREGIPASDGLAVAVVGAEVPAGAVALCARIVWQKRDVVARDSRVMATQLGFGMSSSRGRCSTCGPMKIMEGGVARGEVELNFVVKYTPARSAGGRT